MAKRILLVDDEPDILKIVRYRLVKKGYDVHVAVDGKQGLAFVESLKPDLVITDFKMPFIDGLELCKIIKGDERFKRIPVIMLTASIESAQRIKAQKIPVDEIIVKPFEPENVIETVIRLIGEAT